MTTQAPSVRPSVLHAWMMAARPPTLPAAVVPVLVGTAAVYALRFRPLPFIAALLAAVLIQIGTNFANDYFDFHKGADTAERLGPARVTQSGLIAPGTVRNAMIAVFGPVALIVTAIIVVNNLRDIDTDRKARKHTLAVLLGRRATQIEYLILLAGAYLLLPLGVLLGLVGWWSLLPVLTLPLAIALIRTVFTVQGRPLNRALAGTGRLHLIFGILFAIGLLLGSL